MSYIKRKLFNAGIKDDIVDFCRAEGFLSDTWHGEKCLIYSHYGGSYVIRVMVYPFKIGYYVEYDCGGEVSSGKEYYDTNDFEDFRMIYERIINEVIPYTK